MAKERIEHPRRARVRQGKFHKGGDVGMKVAQNPELVESFRRQATTCASMGAPFTARLCQLLGDHLDDRTAFGRRVLAWPLASLRPDLLPLRCCAALNLSVRRGDAGSLATFYPPGEAGDDQAMWSAIERSIRLHDEELTEFLNSPPQTNEVARSGILLGGLLTISAQTGMPLALFELGASAGLNLLFDRYCYRLGDGLVWGDPASPVQLECAWSGQLPALDTKLEVASRGGVDLQPIDARKQADRERLLAYIWPEQLARITRIEAALDMMASTDLRVESGDAVAWLERQLAEQPVPGVCRVIYHSVFIQYLPAPARAGLREEIRARGAEATSASPIAWLAMESAPDHQSCHLKLTIWPGGEPRLLATVDWHGKKAHFT